MTAAELLKSAHSDKPMPQDLIPAHQALWLEQAGEWHRAHDMCDSIPDPAGSWIHAYLHRVEGDLPNASYWYHRAGKEMPSYSLEQEWLQLVDALA
ncbi:hypothetical protein ACFPK9_08480 [Rubritalea spongiae]|uniref:Tetratricopeptide repeat protein n=1 Tax=Rubritalea spongiae TaxID=430797 RepID=A0ABW5E769_9BACT